MIWRRVLVPTSMTLRELHGILQVVMGWEGIHLFLFDIYAVRYGSFELHAANPDVSLHQFGFRENERFLYIYDMGDHWEHEIRIEAINPPLKKSHPVCIGGSGTCPPEDCGGQVRNVLDNLFGCCSSEVGFTRPVCASYSTFSSALTAAIWRRSNSVTLMAFQRSAARIMAATSA